MNSTDLGICIVISLVVVGACSLVITGMVLDYKFQKEQLRGKQKSSSKRRK